MRSGAVMSQPRGAHDEQAELLRLPLLEQSGSGGLGVLLRAARGLGHVPPPPITTRLATDMT